MKNLKWWVKRFFWFISFSDKKTCLTSKSPIKFTLVMPSVAVWLSGGPCWLQHLFWPWTALASAWACALPRLGVFFFFLFCSSKKSSRLFCWDPFLPLWKRLVVVMFFGDFLFSGQKKGPRGNLRQQKKPGENRQACYRFFPDFDGIFFDFDARSIDGKTQVSPDVWSMLLDL